MNSIVEEREAAVKEIRYSIQLIKQSPLTIVGLVIITGIIFIAIFAPFLAPYDPFKVDTRNRLKPPSSVNLLGTDDMGRDILSRIIYGSRISLMVGVVVLAISLSIGVPLGAVSGYFGGKIDSALMRITDVFLGLPSLILALSIAAAREAKRNPVPSFPSRAAGRAARKCLQGAGRTDDIRRI